MKIFGQRKRALCGTEMSKLCSLLIVCAFACFVQKTKAESEVNPYTEALKAHPWKSLQKYVEVRPGAFIFYWLYYADGKSRHAEQKPLIIWVQGGPGLAASGLANFAELGPLTMDMKPRNHTWVKGRNVLLIDHPVGTGFSYVTDKSLLVSTDREMAVDLTKVIKMFYRRHKEFRKTPTYIIGQSYGGKICPRLAYYLHTAIENRRLAMNFKGIGIGSGWVDPKESTLVQPEYLYNLGVIDRGTYITASNMAKRMRHLIETKQYVRAGDWDTTLFQLLNKEAGMEINFNNINQASPYPQLAELTVKINKYVKPTLSHIVNQSMEWNYYSGVVFERLNENFLAPSTKFLEMLLNKTELRIAVFNGNLDVVTPLAGASNWAHKLRWHGAEEFHRARRIKIRGTRNGFFKAARQFSFWWVFGAGHWVPEDNPTAMHQILEYVMQENT